MGIITQPDTFVVSIYGLVTLDAFVNAFGK